MRGDQFKKMLDGEVFLLSDSVMDQLEAVGAVDVEKVANDSITYETVQNVAVISVDGAMAKKSYSGLCTNVYGYDTITKFLTIAEIDDSIDTVIFRVDTPGGHVAGVSSAEDRIFKSPLNTYTIYENLGASAGVYLFSASDKIYATKDTEIGSISAKATLLIPKEDENAPEQITIVGKNGANKTCNIDGDCIDRIQEKINMHEEFFLDTVAKNTGMTKDEIVEGFNYGDTIFAEKAVEIGFLDEIKTFHELLNEVVKKPLGATPTAVGDKLAKNQQGENVTAEELKAQLEALTEENATLKAGIKELEAKDTVDVGAAIRAALDEKMHDIKAVVAEAFAHGASAEVAMKMIEAGSPEEASKVLTASMDEEVLGGDDGVAAKGNPYEQTAQKYQGVVK